MTRLTMAAVLLACLMHPMADAGSDSDDALEAGWRELLRGRSPWAARTHLENRITPTLGGLAVSWPAAVVGAEWLGPIGVGLLWHVTGGGMVWMMGVFVSLKTLAQGIDYMYGSSVLCWAVWWAARWRAVPAIGRLGRWSCG